MSFYKPTVFDGPPSETNFLLRGVTIKISAQTRYYQWHIQKKDVDRTSLGPGTLVQLRECVLMYRYEIRRKTQIGKSKGTTTDCITDSIKTYEYVVCQETMRCISNQWHLDIVQKKKTHHRAVFQIIRLLLDML
jgi:hypothetical protein